MTLLPLFLMVIGAAALSLVRDSRRGIIALWFAQVGAGAAILQAGAEMLAVAYWAAATLVCVVFFLHADLFETVSRTLKRASKGTKAEFVFPAVVSVAFAVLVGSLLDGLGRGIETPSPTSRVVQESNSGFNEAFVLLEILSLFSLGAAVAAGVITRARRRPRG